MDSFFFHPRVVHFPVALALLLPLLAGILLIGQKKWAWPHSTWLLGLGFAALSAVSSLAALRSGEAEEDRAKQFVSGKLIHEHEEAGEALMVSQVALTLIMLGAFVLKKTRFATGLQIAAVAAAAVGAGLAVQAGSLGGELVYRHGAARAYSGPDGLE